MTLRLLSHFKSVSSALTCGLFSFFHFSVLPLTRILLLGCLLTSLLVVRIPVPTAATQLPSVTFTDITERAGVTFKHVSSPEKKYIVESMSGGVALLDYDNDGYLDIFFVNSLTVDLVKSKGKTKSALYHNNGDGTFTDVTEKAGVGDIGWGMGVAVGDYNND